MYVEETHTACGEQKVCQIDVSAQKQRAAIGEVTVVPNTITGLLYYLRLFEQGF